MTRPADRANARAHSPGVPAPAAQRLNLPYSAPALAALADCRLPLLERLSVCECNATRAPALHGHERTPLQVVFGAPWFATLQELVLGDLDWRRGGLEGAAAPRLRVLNIRAVDGTSSNVADALGGAAFPALEVAKLEGWTVDDDHPLSQAALARFLAAPGLGATLRWLNLSACLAVDEGGAAAHPFTALAAARLPALRELRLSLSAPPGPDMGAGRAIGETAAAVAAAAWAPQLESLSLGEMCSEEAPAFEGPVTGGLEAVAFTQLQGLALRSVQYDIYTVGRPLHATALLPLARAPWARGLKTLRTMEHFRPLVMQLCAAGPAFAHFIDDRGYCARGLFFMCQGLGFDHGLWFP